jgi:hypothetical protein
MDFGTVVSPAVMAAQVRQLAAVAEMPDVTVHSPQRISGNPSGHSTVCRLS